MKMKIDGTRFEFKKWILCIIFMKNDELTKTENIVNLSKLKKISIFFVH